MGAQYTTATHSAVGRNGLIPFTDHTSNILENIWLSNTSSLQSTLKSRNSHRLVLFFLVPPKKAIKLNLFASVGR